VLLVSFVAPVRCFFFKSPCQTRGEGSLLVKELHLPESLLERGRWRGALDHTPMHSHTLWHCGVWLAQSLYLAMYSEVTASTCSSTPPVPSVSTQVQCFVHTIIRILLLFPCVHFGTVLQSACFSSEALTAHRCITAHLAAFFPSRAHNACSRGSCG
jgi:hypothetical protein